MKDDVRDRPSHYSLIYVPNGFVIPGGRFREIYYWDTYWIVQGMLLCDMRTSVKVSAQCVPHRAHAVSVL